jgi:hypothetical protein
MTHLAIIDLDGVIANSDARFARAKLPDGSIDWNTAFNPDLVATDTPISGAKEAIERLMQRGYTVVFLTSRPIAMQDATVAWLEAYGLEYHDLVMKPRSAQFIKTVRWKASEVFRLVTIAGHEANGSLFIDDEELHRDAVRALGFGITTLASLADLGGDEPIII